MQRVALAQLRYDAGNLRARAPRLRADAGGLVDRAAPLWPSCRDQAIDAGGERAERLTPAGTLSPATLTAKRAGRKTRTQSRLVAAKRSPPARSHMRCEMPLAVSLNERSCGPERNERSSRAPATGFSSGRSTINDPAAAASMVRPCRSMRRGQMPMKPRTVAGLVDEHARARLAARSGSSRRTRAPRNSWPSRRRARDAASEKRAQKCPRRWGCRPGGKLGSFQPWPPLSARSPNLRPVIADPPWFSVPI